MAPSFAIIAERNHYWSVDGQPYDVQVRAFIAGEDAAYQAWRELYEPAAVSASELRTALRQAKLPPFAAVTALQARRALRAAGLYDAVAAAVDGSADTDLKDTWEYAVDWHRDASWIATVGAQLNLSDEQIDDLFVTATTL